MLIHLNDLLDDVTFLLLTNQVPWKCDRTERQTSWHYDDLCPLGSGCKKRFVNLIKIGVTRRARMEIILGKTPVISNGHQPPRAVDPYVVTIPRQTRWSRNWSIIFFTWINVTQTHVYSDKKPQKRVSRTNVGASKAELGSVQGLLDAFAEA